MWIEKTTMQCYKIIGKIIGIHHECECGIIKKYVPRIIDWHHEACRVMANGDREGQIILSITDFFLAHL